MSHTVVDKQVKEPGPIFTWFEVGLYSSIFFVAVIVIQRSLRYVCQNGVEFDCPYYWPVSVFNFRTPSLRDLSIALVVTAAFVVFARGLERLRYDWRSVVASGILLIVGLTFIHGVDFGFYAPIASDAQSGVLVPYSLDGQEYYHDALKVTDPITFLRTYNEIQPTLHRHSHTHPPGAVLSLYFLNEAFDDPALIAIAIMLLATTLTVYFFRRLLLTSIDGETTGYVTFLILLLPALQIYYLASIDALIAGILTATLYYFCFGKTWRSLFGATLLLTTSFLLTFVSLFILPVLVGFEILVKRSIRRSVMLVSGLALAHVIIYLVFRYSPLTSLRTASAFENLEGFMLFVDPINYFFTRLEDLAEIAFFFGPFAAVLFWRGFGMFRDRPLNVLAALACLTMFAMFATGAWRTGETARACLYLYPYLLFPVAHYLQDRGTSTWARLQLAALVFVQSIGMQLLGNYHW